MNFSYKNIKNQSKTPDMLAIKWLSSSEKTYDIFNTAYNFIRLEIIISKFIPKNLDIAFKLIKLENETLSIAVPNSANATRIRYFSKEIIRNIQLNHNLKINDIKIKIHSSCFETSKEETKTINNKSFLNKNNINNFKELKDKLKEGPLKSAISLLIERNSYSLE